MSDVKINESFVMPTMTNLKICDFIFKRVTLHRHNTDRNLIFILVHGISNMKLSYKFQIILKRNEGCVTLTMAILKMCDFFNKMHVYSKIIQTKKLNFELVQGIIMFIKFPYTFLIHLKRNENARALTMICFEQTDRHPDR